MVNLKGITNMVANGIYDETTAIGLLGLKSNEKDIKKGIIISSNNGKNPVPASWGLLKIAPTVADRP